MTARPDHTSSPSVAILRLRTTVFAALGLMGCDPEIVVPPVHVEVDCSEAEPSDTDVVSCEGVPVRRQSATCDLPSNDAPASCETSGVCSASTDCPGSADAVCLKDGDDCSCFVGCREDSHCAAGSVCHCGPHGGICVSAPECRTSADCGEGSECVLYRTLDPCDSSPSYGLACTTPEDTCLPGIGQCPDNCRPIGGGAFECESQSCDIGGRPFLVDGGARVAPIAAIANGWSAPLYPALDGLSDDERHERAAHWAHIAQLEHASVAAFARFAMQLLSLGAPPELIAGATSAMNDELAHARLAFGLASAYADAPVGPAHLPVDGALDESSLQAIVTTLFDEGCIGETFAAVMASADRARETDPVVENVLSRIAEDEAEHGLLAWRSLRWMLESLDRRSVETAVMARIVALEDERATERAGSPPLRRQVIETLVLPAARMLLARTSQSERDQAAHHHA
ncbi:MAG: ferritin-like domain-containing protein [Polyangiaceae bacterium]|nr:ferritin-like domain-containing protein [Polyangiaceae bacterium]